MNRLRSNSRPGKSSFSLLRSLSFVPLLLLALLAVSGCGSSSSSLKVSAITATGPQGTATSIVTGGQLALSATVMNDTKNLGIDWTVSCTNTGIAVCGSFVPAHTASGAITNFTAPATIPIGGTLVITATSTGDPSQSSSLTLTISTTNVVVTLSPPSATVVVGDSQAFTATVTNDPENAGVTFAVTCGSTAAGACGSLSAAGSQPNLTTSYIAPATVPAGGTVTITASSVTDPSKTASATITVTSVAGAVTVTLSQSATSVVESGTATFTATVINDPANAGVTWSVSCGTAGACGAVSPANTLSGASTVFTAPSAVPTPSPVVTVTATSVTDPSQSASASIEITASGSGGGGGTGAIAVSVTPATTTLLVNATGSFVATVTNDSSNSGVSWTVTCGTAGGCGSVSPAVTSSGAATTYMAPATVPTGGTVTLTAASVADPSISASAVVTINPSSGGSGGGGGGLTVSVSPATATLAVNATGSFTATVVNDSTNSGVSWSLSCGSAGGCGSVSPATTSSGAATTYTAPATAPSGGTVTLTATSVASPSVSASAVVTVGSSGGGGGGNITVSVSPTTATVVTGATTPFTATVTNDVNGTNAVNWTATCGGQAACGSFSPAQTVTGIPTTYTAPASVPSGTVTVTATSATNASASASAMVTIIPPPSNVTVAFTTTPPGSATTQANVALSATVSNDPSMAGVDWTVSCGSAGACGKFDPAHTASGSATAYIAPNAVPTGGTVTITATSTASSTATATATLNIVALIGISVTQQPAATVDTGTTTTAAAAVTGDSANQGVDWVITSCQLTPASACGSVTAHTASGAPATYTAPATAPSGGFTVALQATATASENNPLQQPANASTTLISVSAPPPVAISFSQAPPTSVTAGKQFSASASVQNDSADKGVDWTATCGTAGGCGSFSPAHTSDGAATTYTAPGTVPSGGTVTITATSTADPTQSATTAVTIAAAPVTGNALLKGQYAMVLSGQGPSLLQFLAGSFVADGNGNITKGEEDVATGCVGNSNCPTSEQSPNLKVPFTGTYTIGSDERGTITLNTGVASLGVNGVQTFKISLVSPQHGFIAEFDGNANASATAAATESGTFDLQAPADFAAAPTGSYAFTLNASDNGNASAGPAGGVMTVSAGQFTTGSNGSPNLELDATFASGLNFLTATTGEEPPSFPLAGTGFSAPDPVFGRGTLTLPGTGNEPTYTLVYYLVDTTHFILFYGDATNMIAAAGAGYVQSTPASTDLSGAYAFTESGQYGGGPSEPRSIGGSFSCDGISGDLTGSLDVVSVLYKNGAPTLANAASEPVTGSCGTFDALGRAVVSIAGETAGGLSQFVVYQTQSQGLLLLEPDEAASGSFQFATGVGVALAQDEGAAFSGNYAANLQSIDSGFSNFAYVNNVDIVGQVVSDGVSALTGTVDVDQYAYGGGTLTPNVPVAGTFTANTDGRYTGTLDTTSAEQTAQIFYIVSDGTVLTLRMDGWGGIGILELQQF